MDQSYQTLLDADDIFHLLQGKVLFRESTGGKAIPPTGTTFSRTHPMEIAIGDEALKTVLNYLSPEMKEVISKSTEPADEAS